MKNVMTNNAINKLIVICMDKVNTHAPSLF